MSKGETIFEKRSDGSLRVGVRIVDEQMLPEAAETWSRRAKRLLKDFGGEVQGEGARLTPAGEGITQTTITFVFRIRGS